MNDDDDLDLEVETVILNDDDGRSLQCSVERSMDVDGQSYALLMPIDIPIEIFAWEEDDEEDEVLVDVEDSDINDIFDTARAVLAEQDLILQRTALTLTAVGELPDAEEDDIIVLDMAESESSDDESEQEELQTLATFFYEDREYTICTPVSPLLFFARMNDSGKPELLNPEEFRRIQPQLEDQLFDDLDD